MPEYRKESKAQGKKSQFNSQSPTIKREGQKLYESKNGRKTLICHADLNGAMNIARKLISEFNIKTIRKNNDNKDIYGYSIVSLRNYAVANSMLKKIV